MLPSCKLQDASCKLQSLLHRPIRANHFKSLSPSCFCSDNGRGMSIATQATRRDVKSHLCSGQVPISAPHAFVQARESKMGWEGTRTICGIIAALFLGPVVGAAAGGLYGLIWIAMYWAIRQQAPLAIGSRLLVAGAVAGMIMGVVVALDRAVVALGSSVCPKFKHATPREVTNGDMKDVNHESFLRQISTCPFNK